MDTQTCVALGGAISGAAVGIAGVVVGGIYASRSAAASKQSAAHGKTSAEASVESAQAARDLIDVEKARDADQRRARLEEQAREISAWFYVLYENQESGSPDVGATRVRWRAAKVRNGSTAPIWEVAVRLRERRPGAAGEPLQWAGPYIDAHLYWPSILPGETVTEADRRSAHYHPGETWGVFVVFRSSNGEVWHRDGLGHLHHGPIDWSDV